MTSMVAVKAGHSLSGRMAHKASLTACPLGQSLLLETTRFVSGLPSALHGLAAATMSTSTTRYRFIGILAATPPPARRIVPREKLANTRSGQRGLPTRHPDGCAPRPAPKARAPSRRATWNPSPMTPGLKAASRNPPWLLAIVPRRRVARPLGRSARPDWASTRAKGDRARTAPRHSVQGRARPPREAWRPRVPAPCPGNAGHGLPACRARLGDRVACAATSGCRPAGLARPRSARAAQEPRGLRSHEQDRGWGEPATRVVSPPAAKRDGSRRAWPRPRQGSPQSGRPATRRDSPRPEQRWLSCELVSALPWPAPRPWGRVRRTCAPNTARPPHPPRPP